MGRTLLAHSSAMFDRLLVGLGLSMVLLACGGNTTSLGGPDPATSSASSSDEEADGGSSKAPEGVFAPDTRAPRTVCYGYSWDPVPSTMPCEYFLPERTNDDPRLDPKTWNPYSVTILVMKGGGKEDVGAFMPTSEGCGSADGWYYVDPGDAGKPTLFAICPKTCESFTKIEGALLRLEATTHCEGW